MSRYFISLSLLCLLIVTNSSGQSQSPCKDSPEYRQLDFWIGEWEVRNPKGDKVGESSIQLIVGDCVILENYSSVGGYTGKSLNIYNGTLKKWQQFWVDNQGGVLEFVGEYEGGKLTYRSESQGKDGERITHRMTFFDLPGKNVRQRWEQSMNGGKEWKTVFDGTYTRKDTKK